MTQCLSRSTLAGGLLVGLSLSAFGFATGASPTGSSCSIAAATLSSPPATAAAKDIVDTAVGAGQFNTLVAALKAANLVDALRGDGPFTVFAPTDDAFAKLPKGTLESLLKPENAGQLKAILLYHVVPGRYVARDVMRSSTAKTLNGQRLAFEVNAGSVKVDGAKVVAANVECANGVIHVIDTVVLPQSATIVEVAQKAGTFNTLLAAAKAAGLVETLIGKGPFTILAPTDAAFAKLPTGTVESLLKPENRDQLAAILKYHVISGRVSARDAITANMAKTLQGQQVIFDLRDGQLLVDGARVIATDIDGSNGVIHVIDSVLLPAEM